MSLLIYCVLNGRRGPARPSVRGVDKRPVWVLECGGLCAAVAEVAAELEGGAAQLNELLAYARTVEAFGRRETVVPMRYGCRLGNHQGSPRLGGRTPRRIARIAGPVRRLRRNGGADTPGARITGPSRRRRPRGAGSRGGGAQCGRCVPGRTAPPAGRRQSPRTHRLRRARRAGRAGPRSHHGNRGAGPAYDGIAVLPDRENCNVRFPRSVRARRRCLRHRNAAERSLAALQLCLGSQAGDTFAQRVIAPASMPYASHDESGHGATVTS